ncbi:MAG: NAD-dependent epimerase/dehydratase family protein [Pseudomonadota bacterium]|nr:NAD-dependent epimerase/dehydratase family protein [Pseudomonadota bacterium]
MQKKVLIIGYGYVGQKLAEILLKDNYKVFAIKRQKILNNHEVSTIYSPIEKLSPEDIPNDLTYVFYLLSATEYSEEAYNFAYKHCLERTYQLIKKQANIKRFIFCSSTSIYEKVDGSWCDEYSVTNPSAFPGKTMLAAENFIFSQKLPAVSVRLSGIYGPNRARIIENVRKNKPSFSDSYTNRIHRDDAARALYHLMKLKNPLQVYLATDSYPEKQKNIEMWLASVLNIKLKNIATEDNSKRNKTNKRLRNKNLLESGFKFNFPNYKKGLLDILSQEDP